MYVIPARYVLALMGCLGVALALMMRACLAIAITEMVVQTTHKSSDSSGEYCLVGSGNKSGTAERSYTTLDPKFDWSSETQGFILSAFYYGYVLTHIPGSILSQKIGGKYTLGLGFLFTAFLTLFTPLVASFGSTAMVLLRFLMGLGEGPTFPALCALIAQWAPINERTLLSSVVFAGVQLGSLMATFCSGIIMNATQSWAMVFYIYGVMACVWFLLWCVLCYNDPESHPFIGDEEKKYIVESLGTSERPKNLKTPWVPILTSLPVWSLVIAEVGHDYGLYLIATDLPKYMSEVIGLSVKENGLLSGLPFLMMWLVSIACSVLADYLIGHGIMSPTNVRKSFGSLGAILPGVGALLASYVGCNKTLVAFFFTSGMAFMGFCYASIRVNPIDLSPNFSATVMALGNGIGCMSGMVAPLTVGFLTKDKTISEWRVVFWIMFLALFLTNIVYVIFASGEVQWWNEAKPLNSGEEENTESGGDKNGNLEMK